MSNGVHWSQGRVDERQQGLQPIQRSSSTPAHDDTMIELPLHGCRPAPLASYLKALGVLRLIGEQADPEVRGFWFENVFRISTRMTKEKLLDFFLTDYRPTPILAPWNGGSGFHPKDNLSGIVPIQESTADRFAPFRRTIAEIRAILGEIGITDGMRTELKEILLARLRAELNDEALTWFDAAILLTDEAPRYPPLLGTGGNDGRLDFTNNFMQRLVELFDPATGSSRPSAVPLLRGALFGEPIPRLWDAAIGQYAPADTGGANATTGFSRETLMNPWDFVLMMEGAVLFAASASRRLDSDSPAQMAYPFTVRPTGAGSGSTAPGDEGASRGEMWMPLWQGAVTLWELRALLGEGRAVLNGRPVRDGLDFVRAVSKLGVDRGISEFVRYGFLMRNGKAYLATPLTRVKVRANPESELIDELDQHQWLSYFKSASSARGSAPTRLISLGRRLQDGLFRMAKREGGYRLSTVRVQEVLIVLGEIQRYCASSPNVRDAVPPVPPLSAQWARSANDGSAEFLVAAALAGLGARKRHVGEGQLLLEGKEDDPRQMGMRMAAHFAPVAGERWIHGWNEGSREVVWGEGDLLRSLQAVLERRLLVAGRDGSWEKPLAGSFGAPLGAIAGWLRGGPAFDARVGQLLPGLALVRIPRSLPDPRSLGVLDSGSLPIAYALLKPFFTPERELHRAGLFAPSEDKASIAIPLPLALVRAIAAEPTLRKPGEFGVMAEVHRRLRLAPLRRANTPNADDRTNGDQHCLSPALRGVASLGVEGRRLLAALMVPISAHSLRRVCERLFAPSKRITDPLSSVVWEEDVDTLTFVRE